MSRAIGKTEAAKRQLAEWKAAHPDGVVIEPRVDRLPLNPDVLTHAEKLYDAGLRWLHTK